MVAQGDVVSPLGSEKQILQSISFALPRMMISLAIAVRAFSVWVLTVEIESCALPHFVQKAHKGWGTQIVVHT
jgi:hypothetical protein